MEPISFQEQERRSSLSGQTSQSVPPSTPPLSTAPHNIQSAGPTPNSQNSDGKHFLGENFSVLGHAFTACLLVFLFLITLSTTCR